MLDIIDNDSLCNGVYIVKLHCGSRNSDFWSVPNPPTKQSPPKCSDVSSSDVLDPRVGFRDDLFLGKNSKIPTGVLMLITFDNLVPGIKKQSPKYPVGVEECYTRRGCTDERSSLTRETVPSSRSEIVLPTILESTGLLVSL